MQAVVEVPMLDSRVPWPVEPLTPGSWLVLDADCPDERIGLFVAALASGIEVASPGGHKEVADALLAEELLIVAGGVRVCDARTGTNVVPGCCSGLEDWRDWAQALAGGSPWLGHDPAPEVEVLGEDLRVWQDSGPNRRRGPWADHHIDFPRRALAPLLMRVQRDLVGFLNALAGWAARSGLGRRGTALVNAVDRSFAVTAPLDVPTG
ncbi:hypothetical protein ACLQ2S_23465 [Micromonospora sp. DT48]|uniref:hypothetical protein n=1 Tax=unclassified Micromonospora TaxID=2617518 RepID=UPI0012BB5AC0|nr:hypothetical protein [Micromonospora sp. CP22]MTK03443.1 hypothetical protein [Micromonospora sp. CP22]